MSANLAALLHAQAVARPHHPALLTPNRPPITFAALHKATQQGAAWLLQAGLRPGDTVLVYQPISADLYVALGALFYAGLTVVFIDPGMRGVQLDRAANALSPRGFMATPRAHLLRLLSPAIRHIPIKFTTGQWPLPGTRRWDEYARGAIHDVPPMVACDADTPALITVTSGSTGTPKFATRSHGFLRRQHRAIDASLDMDTKSVVASTLPIFILSFLASGVTVLLPDLDLRRPGHVKIAPLLAQMQQADVNTLAASPALLDQVARYCAETKTQLPQIRQVYTGGAPVFVDLMDEVAATMPHARFHAVYGATEAEPIAILDRASINAADRQRMASGAGLLVGDPVPSLSVRVIPDRWGQPHGPYASQAWEDVSLWGETGEIVVAGPHVLTAAHPGVDPGEDAALTKIPTQITGGEQLWHRTGDAGYFDEQGRLWLVGRCSARLDRVLSDGTPLYSFRVESAAHTFPAVKHAALIAQAGQCVLAIELYTPQSAAWFATLHSTLAWAGLDEIRILPRMPVDKRHNAKIDYPALRKLLRGK